MVAKLNYHHPGIPTKKKRENEVYLEKFKTYVSGYNTSPYKIEWMRFEDGVSLPELVKNNWELEVYPLESHRFTEPGSWTDEHKRIFKLFEENLNKK